MASARDGTWRTHRESRGSRPASVRALRRGSRGRGCPIARARGGGTLRTSCALDAAASTRPSVTGSEDRGLGARGVCAMPNGSNALAPAPRTAAASQAATLRPRKADAYALEALPRCRASQGAIAHLVLPPHASGCGLLPPRRAVPKSSGRRSRRQSHCGSTSRPTTRPATRQQTHRCATGLLARHGDAGHREQGEASSSAMVEKPQFTQTDPLKNDTTAGSVMAPGANWFRVRRPTIWPLFTTTGGSSAN